MSSKRNVWLEVALNGPWGRDRQPGIPIEVDEIIAQGIACARAGAGIVHVHAYDAKTGRQNDDWKIYAAIINGIRAEVDVIVYPSIPLSGDKRVDIAGGPKARFAAVSRLADEGLLEWAVVDPGSVNLEKYEDVATAQGGFIYQNSFEDIHEGLSLARAKGFHPSYAIYEPGFLRLGAEMARRQPNVPAPIYRFMFSDAFTFGYAPRAYALDAYLSLLEEEAKGGVWMIAGLGVDIGSLVDLTIARGGGLRVGLEDAAFGTTKTNLEYVEDMVRKIEANGGAPASADEIRTTLRAL